MRHHAFKQLKGVGSTANTVGYRSDLHLAAAAENMGIAAAWAIGSTPLGGKSVHLNNRNPVLLILPPPPLYVRR